MNKKQIKELINDGFNRLYPLTHWTWRDHRSDMLDHELKLQKKFRAEAPSSIKWDHTNQTVAKYFVLYAIKQAFASDNFRPRDILHCSKTYITGITTRKNSERWSLTLIGTPSTLSSTVTRIFLSNH
jgi:hypothetical protein